MHVLWTPSWYPSQEYPNNGSFFKEQLHMLTEGGFQCGVICVETTTIGHPKATFNLETGDVALVRTGTWLVPHGILPIDRFLIKKQALKAARAYEQAFGTPDIIHAHSVWPGIVVAQTLSKYWGIPYGLTEHRPSSLTASKNSNRAKMIQKAVESAAFYVTVSEGMRQLLEEYYKVSGVKTIALPARDAFFEAPLHSLSEGTFRFIHISNLDDNKRTVFTLETFAKFHAMQPDTELIIVGGESLRVAELAMYAQELGISEAVTFTGQVSRAEIIDTFNQADCMILVSALEAGGTVFAEASSLGIPSIASNTFGGSFMITSENGEVIEVDDAEALLQAMNNIRQRYRDNPNLNHEIRELARNRFSERTFVAENGKLYKRAIGNVK